MRLDVWSDVVCPWCYLGARRLDLALARLDWGAQVEVRWRAYQLDPRAPADPQDLRTSLDRRYGPGAFDAFTPRLVALGAEVGLDYRFDLARRVNTFDAHRLLAWAWERDPAAQRALSDRLFRAYFTLGENVADHTVLVAAAGEVGLERDEAGAVLADEALFADDVRADVEAAFDRGITGVPAFVVEGAWLIPGAQDVETLVTVLERARERLAPASEHGEVCAVDDPRC